MKRRIIEIDQDKCNGCGACAAACHEGAIAMVDGKARLMRDDYCDGLGDCLPACPTGAITFVEREAAAYDEQAVMENKQRKMRKEGMTLSFGRPGSKSRNIQRQDVPAVETPQAQQTSRLSQWPVQIKLVPVNAPYFDGARLLIAADCTAYAYAAFHERFITPIKLSDIRHFPELLCSFSRKMQNIFASFAKTYFKNRKRTF